MLSHLCMTPLVCMPYLRVLMSMHGPSPHLAGCPRRSMRQLRAPARGGGSYKPQVQDDGDNARAAAYAACLPGSARADAAAAGLHHALLTSRRLVQQLRAGASPSCSQPFLSTQQRALSKLHAYMANADGYHKLQHDKYVLKGCSAVPADHKCMDAGRAEAALHHT